jgi:lon-related putative ATP-dependent protease
LCRRCHPAALGFQTTAELDDTDLSVGQSRAMDALRLGVGIEAAGYNLFVLGSAGNYRHRIVRQFLEQQAAGRETAPDWCYVENFEDERRPLVLRLPASRGRALRADLARLTEEIGTAIPSAFESERYQIRAAELQRQLEQRERRIIEGKSEEISSWMEHRRHALSQLRGEIADLAASAFIRELESRYADAPEAARHLRAIREHAARNALEPRPQEAGHPASARAVSARYTVNLLVTHARGAPAPVIYESHPTLTNLMGCIESVTRLGTVATDFTLIRPGALHRANGGFLILDAERLLAHPPAWNALKRTLYDRHIRIPHAEHTRSTASLEPEPVPLDVKVVLIGDRNTHGLLFELDPDFAELFKVAADFETRIERDSENTARYARLIATLARQSAVPPLTNEAVARVIEQGARLVGDAQMLTTRLRDVHDLVREAGYWASRAGSSIVSGQHVEEAVAAQIQRLGRPRAEILEEIERRSILIDTEGAKVGQINGLSVMEMASFSFGQPCRITANVRVGEGEILDIERETELGGAIHSKGVLILASYLASRFATDTPLSMAASLVFEQSYVGVEGDSASLAETCALLSALSELPLEQALAVTGSVNQHGVVQVIGGVNEKIEGFFDVCEARGLTGRHGVLIPEDNVQHLMLRRDVVEAAAAGMFHVYPVRHIDDAIAILTGVPAGRRNARGAFPRGTVNHRVERTLRRLADVRREFDQQTEKKKKMPDD